MNLNNNKNRLATGGYIDRSRPLDFTFNGKPFRGYAGDTVASALLANGVRVVSRSFKYHRPRGIVTVGAEEPNAIFTIGRDGHHTPNVRATLAELLDGMEVRSQSGWPSVDFDAGALLSAAGRLLPAGFYYKTFMWPPQLWMFYEKFIRRAASRAQVPQHNDANSYAHRQAHCDVLIAGGGAAGLMAALSAGSSGARVIVADMNPQFGGSLLDCNDEIIDDMPAAAWAQQAIQKLSAMENVQLLSRTTVQGCHDYNAIIAVENIAMNRFDEVGLRQRLWKIRARQLVIAAGAIERPMVFADNDRPGVMMAAAVRACIHRYGVLPGRNFLFFTNNDSAYKSALDAKAAGARRVEIADIRPETDGYWRERARDNNIQVHAGYGVCGARMVGDGLNVQLGRLSPGAEFVQAEGGLSSLFDVLAVSGGWTPTVHLFSQARGALLWDAKIGAFLPGDSHPLNPARVCGAAAGAQTLSDCLHGGAQAGMLAAADSGFDNAAAANATTAAAAVESPPLHIPLVPTHHAPGEGPGKHFVDWMNDVTAADIFLAAREGYESVEHMKRYTAAGFGTDQGKTGNINALTLLAAARGDTPDKVGHTTYRPQYTPTSFGAVTGYNRREFFAPIRTTPMHEWHVKNNAVFEDVGEWKRPCYFPHGDEDMATAVARECRAARSGAALMDASTLGKIDIQGADAATFLDMVYSNAIGALPPGRCRYGLMLREDGMVYDDGVAMRLSDTHFHITTSTGHAAGVMNWLEEWLQTEWPRMQVYCTSVTEQWAVAALVGPRARDILGALTGADTPLSTEDFPFMHWQAATVAGVPVRLCRVSFSGELAFEINIPARYGLFVWEQLLAAGAEHNITPYGTETMRVLRAEKGYIIAGQDSDGATSPIDMGMSWMLSKKKKDYLGKRSLSRPDITRRGRRQFVGLLTEDPNALIPEGAHLCLSANETPPFTADGHVTSSYMSATLQRTIALAMVRDGTSRYGDTVYAALLDGRRIAAKITEPVFWDKEGARQNG